MINTRGGLVHFTGIAWAGGAGERLDEAPPAVGEPGFASGACLAIPQGALRAAGRLRRRSSSSTTRTSTSRFGSASRAGGSGWSPPLASTTNTSSRRAPAKWRLLERNRWATLIRTYPAGLLALLAPALAVTELALVPISIAGGWFGQKLAAWGDLLRAAPRLRRERRKIQADQGGGRARVRRRAHRRPRARRTSARAGRSRVLRAALRAYWALVLGLLGSGRA